MFSDRPEAAPYKGLVWEIATPVCALVRNDNRVAVWPGRTVRRLVPTYANKQGHVAVLCNMPVYLFHDQVDQLVFDNDGLDDVAALLFQEFGDLLISKHVAHDRIIVQIGFHLHSATHLAVDLHC